MHNFKIIGAGTDLGVSIDGARFGPKKVLEQFKTKDFKTLEQDDNIQKSIDSHDMKKNYHELLQFNTKLYKIIQKEKKFCITIGGDHSISIASGLASLKKHDNLGLIWIDAHLDYNTFQTTITGNLHGFPLASLNGLNKELSTFHKNNYFNPQNTIVVGYRAFKEENSQLEINNIKTMGVTVFTTNDIKEMGISKIMELAYSLASKNTNGVHISFDLDVIDPSIAKGVSVKEENGIDENDIQELISFLKEKKETIKSFDIVEYNPLFDTDKNTLKIILNILKEITN